MAKRCKGGFATFVDGVPHVYAGGQLVGDGDPILRSHGHLFEAVDEVVARQEAAPLSVTAVETATSAPGEVRQTSVARGRAGREAGVK